MQVEPTQSVYNNVEQQEALEFSTNNFTQHTTCAVSILWSITP